MKIAISVLLSGAKQAYHYYMDSEVFQLIEAGMKVVVPNKIKEDGTLSMSIGTFIGCPSDVSVEGLKPIVQVIAPGLYLAALHEVKAMEATT